MSAYTCIPGSERDFLWWLAEQLGGRQGWQEFLEAANNHFHLGFTQTALDELFADAAMDFGFAPTHMPAKSQVRWDWVCGTCSTPTQVTHMGCTDNPRPHGFCSTCGSQQRLRTGRVVV